MYLAQYQYPQIIQDLIFSGEGPENFTHDKENIVNLNNAGCYTFKVTDTLTNCSIDATICINDETGI